MRTPNTTHIILPTYADNNAAKAGWLIIWDLYKTSWWVVMIVV